MKSIIRYFTFIPRKNRDRRAFPALAGLAVVLLLIDLRNCGIHKIHPDFFAFLEGSPSIFDTNRLSNKSKNNLIFHSLGPDQHILIPGGVDGEQKILWYVTAGFNAYGQSTFNIPHRWKGGG